MSSSYTEVVLDTSFYTTYGKDGKFIVHRSIDGGASWLPHYEVDYPGETYRDINIIPGHTYLYRFRFVLGARDSGWSNIITLVAPYPPTPTPTHAVYRYVYSHKIHHPRLSGVTGRYGYKKVYNCARAENVDSDGTVIAYCPSLKVWLITTAKSFLEITFLGPALPTLESTRDKIEGLYYGDNNFSDEYNYKKTEDGGTLTYTPGSTTPDQWTIGSATDTSIYDLQWPAPMSSSMQIDFQLNHGSYRVSGVEDISQLDAKSVRSLLESPAVYFYQYSDDCSKIPEDWTPAPYWDKNPYFDDPPIVVPYEPTPTPTITPSPSPTPSPTVSSGIVYTPTPTPTPTTTPTPTPTPTDYAVPLNQCIITPTPTLSPTPTSTYTPTPTPTPTVTPTPTPTDVGIVLDLCDPSRILTETGDDIISEMGHYLITE